MLAFCRWISEKEPRTYRLPTETEWEFACRAGTMTLYPTGDDPRSLQGSVNAADLSLKAANRRFVTWAPWNDGFPATAPVGSFSPSVFGLYDMLGNVWELPIEGDGDAESRSSQIWPGSSASGRLLYRGGSWYNQNPGMLRPAVHHPTWKDPSHCDNRIGFRVVCLIPTKVETAK